MLLEQLKVSSVDMAPDVKEVHDALLTLKRDCCSFVDGTDVRLVDVIDLHHRIDASQVAMMAAFNSSRHDTAADTPSSTPSLEGPAAPPKGHAVCAELLNDCHGMYQCGTVRMHSLLYNRRTGGLVVACP